VEAKKLATDDWQSFELRRSRWRQPAKEQRPEAEQDAVTRRQVRSSPARSGENEELLPDQQILCDERSGAARTKQPSDGAQQAKKQ
jgi:hypothetical protein